MKRKVMLRANNLGQKLLDCSNSKIDNAEAYKILHDKFFKLREKIVADLDVKITKDDLNKIDNISDELEKMFLEIESLETIYINRILKAINE